MKKLILISSLMLSAQSWAADCRTYVARVKQPGGTYQDYDKIDKALNKAEAGDTVLVGRDTTEEITVNNSNNIVITGECNNKIRMVKIQKSTNVVLKDLSIGTGKSNKGCIQLVANNRNHFNDNITLKNLDIKNCLSNGVEIDAFNTNIKIEDSRIQNNAGYGIIKSVEQGGPKPQSVELLNNSITGNNGAIVSGQSSKDLGNFLQILDATDSGNQTTANNEGPGVGTPVASDLVAITGADQTLGIGEVATLDGTASYTLANRSLSYSWIIISKPSGSQAVLQNSASPKASFTIDQEGDYLVELSVNDGFKIVKDQVRISTENSRPVAVIRPHAKITVGEEVFVDGSDSFDPDETSVAYQWQLVKRPASSAAQLVDATTSEPHFIADQAGDYVLELQTSDGTLVSKKVRRTISTGNNAPVADAGEAQSSYRNVSVTLDGHYSQDADMQVLSYQWTLIYSPASSIVNLTNANQSIAQFTGNKNGIYIFNLLVSDGTLKDAQTVVVELKNRAPVVAINVSNDRVERGATVLLSSAASDPDGDNITYQWQMVSRPAGSNIQIQNAQSANASFVADIGGQFKVRLIVTDVFGESVTAETLVKATTRPVARVSLSSVSVNLEETITFNGSQSSDADGDPITFHWQLSNSPDGAYTNIVPENPSSTAKVYLTKAGSYSATLIVSDGVFDSIPVTVNFSAVEKVNHAPVLSFIPPQTVEVAQTLKINLNATDSDNDKISYLISSSTPLLKNMTFNGLNGEFTFRPSVEQSGSHTITFVASDGKSSSEQTTTINVTAPVPNQPTTYRGRVYDANSTSIGYDVPIQGAVVSMMGSNVQSITDANGEFLLENIPLEANVFKIDCKDAKKAPDGSTYGNFIELMHLVPGANNVESRPFYLPRLAANSITQVEANKETVVTNLDLGVQVVIPKNGVVNPDGTPYTDTLSISLVPRALAPVTLPEQFNPGMLITVQPSGVRFAEPVPISYPNIDKLPPGTETNIYQIDDSTGMFGVFARGRVNADGSRIETISGGLVNGSWGFVAPPPAIDLIDPYNSDDCPDEGKCKVGSEIDLKSGALTDDVAVTTYKSAGVERGFKFVYSSVTAKPFVMFDPVIKFPNANAMPEYVSTQLYVEGAKVGDEIYMDTRELPRVAGERIQQKVPFDASHLETGIYRHDIFNAAHFPATILGFRASESPNYGGDFGVINNTQSAYGAGWSIDVLKSLHFHKNGNAMLVRNGGSYKIFKRSPNGSYDLPKNEYLKLEKVGDVGYKITDKKKYVYNFNVQGQLISEIDRNGNETTYYYNANGSVQVIEDPTGKKFKFFYGADGRLERVEDPAARSTNLIYDVNGNLIKIRHPDLSSREMNYNEAHMLLSKTNLPPNFKKKKSLNSFGYPEPVMYKFVKSEDCSPPILDAVGTVVKDTKKEKKMTSYNSIQFPAGCGKGSNSKATALPLIKPSKDAVSVTDNRGNVTRFDLDVYGLPVRKFDPLNRLTQTLRDDRGNIVFEEDAGGRIKQTLFDQKNNPTQITIGPVADSTRIKITYDSEFSQPVSIEEIGKGTTLFKLDTRGNVIASKDSVGGRSYFAYNAKGQVITSTDSSKNQTQLMYYPDGNLKEVQDPQGNVSRFFYDLAGNIERVQDAKNQETVFVYDVVNKLKQVTNANNEVTKFEYDYRGNLTAVVDSRNQRTQFVFNTEDRLVERIDPRGLSEFYDYDLDGNLLSHTDKKGRKISYEYNATNELVRKILPNGQETELTYDLSGNLKTIQDEFSKLTFTYDALNRMKSTSTVGAPYQPGVTLTNTYTKSNRTKLSTDFGDVSWAFDTLNRVSRITSFSGNQISYSYDLNGRRSQVQYPNGITTKLSYDESSRLEKIAHQGNNVDVVSYSYKHDSNGNRTQMNVTSPVAQAMSQINYTYDQVNQLIGATKNVSSNTDEAFTYDSLGNRLKKNNQSANNVYDNNNRIVEDDKFTYSHDDNGNMIKKVNKATGFTYKYVWDYENRLQFVTEHATEGAQATKTHTYMYDALGRRILKDSNGVTRKYIYDGEDILLEFDNDDQLQAKFTHGPGIDEPVEMSRDGNAYYYHTDGLGSITGLTDANGNVVQSYSYSSFGETKVYNQNGAEVIPEQMIQNPYGFTGREWDADTNLYYYRTRYYDPDTGRFISEDIIGFESSDTNLYRYVFNRSPQLKDPDGKIVPFLTAGILAGAINVTSALISGETDSNELIKRFMSGFLIGGAGVLGGPVLAGITNALIEISNQTREACGKFDKGKILRSFFTGYFSTRVFNPNGVNNFEGIFKPGVIGGSLDTIFSSFE